MDTTRSKVAPSSVSLNLKPVSTIRVPTALCWFTAKDKFVVDTQSDALVKISEIDENFRTWFLSGDGKIEYPIHEQVLHCNKLRVPLGNCRITNELGGVENSGTTLQEMFYLMLNQKNGEDGFLLTNEYPTLFFIFDQNGVCRTVHLSWRGRGWRVLAFPFGGVDQWLPGCQVCSRSSFFETTEFLFPAEIESLAL